MSIPSVGSGTANRMDRRQTDNCTSSLRNKLVDEAFCCSVAFLSALMTKLPGAARRMDSGFRRNDGRSRHPGESRDPQRPISTRQRATLHYLTNNIEKYGSGFIRTRKALRDYPELRLEVKETGGGVELIFKQVAATVKGMLMYPSPRRKPGPSSLISLDSGVRRNDEAAIDQHLLNDSKQVAESMGVEGSVEILDLIASKPRITAKKLAQMFGVSLRAVEKKVAKLKREGRLIRIGPNKGGY